MSERPLTGSAGDQLVKLSFGQQARGTSASPDRDYSNLLVISLSRNPLQGSRARSDGCVTTHCVNGTMLDTSDPLPRKSYSADWR